MKNYITLFAIFFSLFSYAQVGVNTTTPDAMLDVNGNLKVREVPQAVKSDSHDFMIIDPVSHEVQKLNGKFASATNTPIAKGVAPTGISLLTTTLFASWQKINFAANNVQIDTGANFDSNDNSYTVPSDGIYEISYYVRYGNGVQAALLSGNTKVGILRQSGSSNKVLDERSFDGISTLLLKVTISSSEINSVYQLNKGDKISFAINRGGVNLELLSSSYSSFVVKKISN